MKQMSSMARRQFRARHSNDKGRSNVAAKPALTHCKCHFYIASNRLFQVLVAVIPAYCAQGHHASLQKYVSSFTSGLLEATPTLPGLDRSIVIPPRRLHLTLGVMSLGDSEDSDIQGTSSRKTLSEALSLLASLGPQISELLRGARLQVPLQIMDIMPPDGGDPEKAHVLWVGPAREDEDAQRLWAVGEMINRRFVEAGFISDRRPLKLHCTILNTTYRRPRARGPRQPFSFASLLASPATQAVLSEPADGVRQPVKVNFGTWHVDEIQICKMGSYGPEGEYESCGGLVLSAPQPCN